MTEPGYIAPSPLLKTHQLDHFDCGNESLNDYLVKYAWVNQQSGASRTYVACRSQNVVGYYSLAFGSVSHKSSTTRVRKGLPRHPIPILLLARLAVDTSEQGRGLGKGLLKNAILRTLQASQIGGLRALLVHAKDKNAQAFYKRYGFESSPTNELHLMLLLKDMKNCIE